MNDKLKSIVGDLTTISKRLGVTLDTSIDASNLVDMDITVSGSIVGHIRVKPVNRMDVDHAIEIIPDAYDMNTRRINCRVINHLSDRDLETIERRMTSFIDAVSGELQ